MKATEVARKLSKKGKPPKDIDMKKYEENL
jgi:hypothetical protein